MIILQGQQLSRVFGSDILFENISIQVQSNSRIALVGRNGTGKSTLLKILADIEKSDSGTLSKPKHISVGYLAQQSITDKNQTIWEEMLSVFTDTIALHKKVEQAALHLTDETVLNNDTAYQQALSLYDTLQHELEQSGGYSYESDIRSVLHGFKFFEEDHHRKISELSGGQKTRLALAKLLLEKHDLLLLDEPTNHLDIETLSWLETYLSNYKGALLIVSHDRYFLDKVAKEVYEITHKTMEHYKGNYSYYLEEKEKRFEIALKEYEKQQVEIAKLEDFVARNLVRASTTKRAQSRRKQLEKMTRIEKPKGTEKSARFQFVTNVESGNVVLQAEDVAIGYDQTILSSPIELDIRKQQAIALIGQNGIGKSTLLKTILGQLSCLNGRITLGSNVTIGYYDQEQENLTPNKTVLQELWDTFPLTNEKDIRSILGSFLFSGDDVTKPVSALSGGEKARLLLAKLSMNQDNFLILDEPTNHLDLDSKEVLENALIDFDGTLLFISHDRYFINRVATAIVELSPNGSHHYLGDYDYYLEKKQQLTTLETTTKKDLGQQQSHYTLSKDAQRQKRQLERRIEQLESDMSHLESQLSEIDEQLTHPDVFSDHQQSHALHEQSQTLRTQYDQCMHEWEELSLTLETLTSP